MKRNICLLAVLLICVFSNAKVQPSALIADNMVLQQQAEARLWGKAEPDATVNVTPSWNNQTYTCLADGKGNWSVSIPTPKAGFTPYEICFDDGEKLTVKGVLIGEVWLASGQSNMEMPLKGFAGCCVEGGFDEIAFSAQWARHIRFFTVPLRQSYEPLEDVEGSWAVPSPQTSPEFSATAWFFATTLSEVLQVPVGIVSCAYGGSKVESWTNRELLEQYPDVSLRPEDMEKQVAYERPMLMYNAMFLPVRHHTVRGILWYQGCSNVGYHQTYARRLANMVELWRSEMEQGDIPFYAVEIAPYEYEGSQDGLAPYLREAQWEAIRLIPNSDMICINDLVKPYERYNIHPGDKKQVGRRLSYLALNHTYGKQQFFCQHPRYKSFTVKGDEVWVAIDNIGMGICRNYDIQGFEVAGEDRLFHPADSVWLHWQTNEIVVSSRRVKAPVAVRYCFRDFSLGTLYGGNWMPLIPFRSDTWE